MLTHRNERTNIRIFVRLEKGSFITFRIFVSALLSNCVIINMINHISELSSKFQK